VNGIAGIVGRDGAPVDAVIACCGHYLARLPALAVNVVWPPGGRTMISEGRW
jgi:hypothetical protein